jgi:hypothetical protein
MRCDWIYWNIIFCEANLSKCQNRLIGKEHKKDGSKIQLFFVDRHVIY